MGRISLKKHQSSAAKKPLKTKKSSGSHIQVIAEDPSENPHCERHGPVLKFRETFDDGRPPSIFYGCSANRDRNSCPFSEHPAAKENLPVQRAAAAEAYETRLMQHAELLAKIRALPAINRAYCGKCSSFVLLPAERHLHNEHSAQLQQSITDEQLQKPTLLLQPLDRDKTEAQYFFDANTLAGIQRMLSAANIRRVVCIGAPRLHEHLRAERESLQIYSVLLDLDERLEPFYERQEFYRFNMFNGWFPDGDARGAEFDAWLRADKSPPLLFADPPFGCQTEPLAQTLKSLQSRFAAIHNKPAPAAPLPIMWIFPYFMAGYVQRSMSSLRANEYAVDYTNHGSYHSSAGGRKQGSPVRIFTNVPWPLWRHTAAECGYVACPKCDDRWRANGTQHCQRCGECASQNGAAYRHCERCACCVKPTYVHCERCGRCVQRNGHDCEAYGKVVTCWICGRGGHLERACGDWQRTAAGAEVWRKWRKAKGKKGGRVCLICGGSGHNERRCAERKEKIAEWTFAGNVYNMFTKDVDD